jgi:hypothetical protein
MRERVESCGGTLVHQGDRGTRLRLSIPVDHTPPDLSAAALSAS